MKRMTMLMALSLMFIALGTFAPCSTLGARPAVADDDGDDDDSGDEGSNHEVAPLAV